jgi:hypothetical protein
MSEVEIAGNAYSVGKLDARRQLHVARRVMPIMGSLVGLLRGQGVGASLSIETALPAMAEQLAAMPDADVDYVIDACLSVCQRQNQTHAGGVWSPVRAPNGRLMFEDVDLGVMLQLVGAVIQENLGGFFGGLGQTSATGEASPQA